VAGLEQQSIQYNTIKSVKYCTRPRLIVISQAIGYKRIPKFISSGWDVFKRIENMGLVICPNLHRNCEGGVRDGEEFFW